MGKFRLRTKFLFSLILVGVGMTVGELRKLTIPSEMAYGAAGFPPVIPPHSTLVFEVELLEVR